MHNFKITLRLRLHSSRNLGKTESQWNFTPTLLDATQLQKTTNKLIQTRQKMKSVLQWNKNKRQLIKRERAAKQRLRQRGPTKEAPLS